MTARLRQEDGFTLVEVMIAAVIMLLIMGATLTALDTFSNNQRRTEKQNATQDAARSAVDQMQRQLRNLASPASSDPSIDKADAFDLVFKTADPQKRRVRYCIDQADPAIPAGKAVLWYQVQAAGASGTTPAMPSTTSCPAPLDAANGGWASSLAVGNAVVNTRDGLSRPLFTYNWPSGASDTSLITRIRAEVFVDVNPGRRPSETRLASGVFLRNQNQTPLATMATPIIGGGHTVIFNGSPSSDPEGRTLAYEWWRGTGTIADNAVCDPDNPPASGPVCVGKGLVYSWQAPSELWGLAQTFRLRVVDPAGLKSISDPILVTP
jgi:prepilin-type N-terminal cleavage/methylation domain-containing protein